jgi:putative signal transducing protein
MHTRNPRDDVVRLVTAANPAEAHLIEQLLTAEGISSRVVGDFLGAGLGDIPGVQPEVWVHRDDVARAEAVLRNKPVGPAGAADEPET